MVSNTHTVSIIVPVYNVSAYIERCIKSVMTQTYKDIECIIVDDVSPDDSITKCEQMIAAYDGPIRFFILRHQQNRGLSAARNTGTDAATGEYLYFLDSDDEMTSDCIEKLMLPILDDNTLEMVQGNHLMVERGGNKVFYKGNSSITISSNSTVFNHLVKYNTIDGAAWNKLLKRSFMEKYQLSFIEGILYEDKPWMFFVQKYLSKAYLSKEITYYYHRRPDSITRNKNMITEGNSYHIIYETILRNLTPGRESKELNGYIYRFCKVYCLYVDVIPVFKETYLLYRQLAKQHSCWYVFFVVNALGIAFKIGNPIRLLTVVHYITWTISQWYKGLLYRIKK